MTTVTLDEKDFDKLVEKARLWDRVKEIAKCDPDDYSIKCDYPCEAVEYVLKALSREAS